MSEQVATKRKVYQCKTCGLNCSTKQALGGHQNSHRRQSAAPKRQKKDDDTPERPLTRSSALKFLTPEPHYDPRPQLHHFFEESSDHKGDGDWSFESEFGPPSSGVVSASGTGLARGDEEMEIDLTLHL